MRQVITLVSCLLVLLGSCGNGQDSAPKGAPAGPPPTLPASAEPLDRGLRSLVTSRTASIETEPTSAEAWGSLGIAFDAHEGLDGEFSDQALQCYSTASELDPSSFRWPYLAATIVYKSDQGAAIQWLERALEAEPDVAGQYGPLFLRRAIGQLAMGAVDDAAADYHKAVSLEPGLVLGWLGLASVALAEDDPERALGHLGRAAEAEPVTDEIHGLYAEAYRRLGRGEDAAASLARMQDGGRREPIPDRLRAEVASKGVSLAWARSRVQTLLELGRPDDAVSTWKSVIQRADSLQAQLGLGDLYIGLARNEEVIALHRTLESRIVGAEATSQERAQFAFQKGVLALGQGDTARGEQLFREALVEDGSHELARGTLGLSEFQRGETSGLEKVRAAAKALGPYSDMQLNLMRVLEEARLWDELAVSLDEFEQARGATGLTRYTRGRLLAGLGRFDEAAAAFREVLEFEPLNESAITNAARAERRTGDESEALAILREGYGRLATPKVRATSPGAGRSVAKELAWNLATTPDATLIESDEAKIEALTLAKELLALSPSNPELMDLVAAAEAASGNFDQAILHLSAALDILGDAGDEGVSEAAARYAKDIRRRLESYRARKRWTRS